MIVPTGSQILQAPGEYKKVNHCGSLADFLRHTDKVPYSMPFFYPQKGKKHTGNAHLIKFTYQILQATSSKEKRHFRTWSQDLVRVGPQENSQEILPKQSPWPVFSSKISSCIYVDLHYYIAEIDLYFSTQEILVILQK